jgi:hypothetical protein
MVETAATLALLLLLLCGLVAFGFVLYGALGLQVAAREAALAAARAPSAEAAAIEGQARGLAVAADYGLTADDELAIVVALLEGFGRGARVEASARARLRPRWLPFFGRLDLTLERRHSERIDRYRDIGP